MNILEATVHPEHLVPYERAARLYCEKVGYDPDESKKVPHRSLKGITVTLYRWYAVAEELMDFNMKLLSLREAALEKQQEKKPN